MIRLSPRRAALIAVEYLLVALAVTIAAILRLGQPEVPSLLWRAGLIAVVLQVCLYYCDLYDLRTLSDRRNLIVALLRALGAASVALALLYYWIPSLVIGRGVFVLASALIVAFVGGWRIVFEWLSLSVGPAERLVIIGTSPAAVRLAKELWDRRHEFGVEIVGFVDSDPVRVGMPVINPGVIGSVAQIPQIVRERRVDRVVVSLADARGKLSMDDLVAMKLRDGVQFDHLASVYEEFTGKIAVENLRPSWVIFSEGFRRSRWTAAAKRSFDLVVAAIGLLLAAPLMAVVALAILAISPGSVLYHQRRVGRNGCMFTMHKFRSMRPDAELQTGAVWAHTDDPRVTSIGRFLRRTRLDELPQLWNVLRGDMSFVGPRPERPEFVAKLTRQIPYYGQRHAVRPGLTGWAQVRYAYASSVEDTLEKLQYDLYYIKHMSFALDLFIVLATIKTVLVRPGS